MTDFKCPECGAVIPEDKESCRDMFDEILAREFSDPKYGKVLRLTIDAYALQHPGSYMISFSSHASHLTGLCVVFKYSASQRINGALKKWYDKKPNHMKVAEPDYKGERTIADILPAKDEEDHCTRVQEWAESAWDAWLDHHETVRTWINEAVNESSVCNVIK